MLLFLGRTKDILGKRLMEILTEAKEQGLVEIFDSVRQSGNPYKVTNFPATILIHGVRENRYFDLIFKPYQYNPAEPDATSIFCVAHNVTEQVLALKKLEEVQGKLSFRNALFEAINEATPDGILVVDTNGKIILRNKRFEEIWRIPQEILETKDDKAALEFAMSQVADPDSFIKEVTSIYNSQYKDNKSEVLFKDGRIIERNGIEIVDEGGFKYGLSWYFRDVTEQVLAKKQLEANEAELQRRVDERTVELDSINAELIKSNSNLEEFALAASHDLKAPLRKINVFAQRLENELQEKLTKAQSDLFERIEGSSTRMTTLIDDLLSFSHVTKGAGEFVEVDLNLKVRNALEDLEVEISEKSATVTVEHLPRVHGNKRQLQQLFQNLISNAIKYTAPEIAPVINISSKEVFGYEANPTLPEAELNCKYNLIEVRDNGIGFDQHYAEQIFKVFTRLHGISDFAGTGIGLSIAQRVVENHTGYIWAKSSIGKGSIFLILLPVLPGSNNH